MRIKSARLGCAMVVTAVERRPDGRLLPYVAVKSVPGRDTSDRDVRRRCCSGAAPSSGGGLERRVGRVVLRYLYLDGLAYSDLETSVRKAYGKLLGWWELLLRHQQRRRLRPPGSE